MPLQWPWDGEGMGVGYEETYVDTRAVSGKGSASVCTRLGEVCRVEGWREGGWGCSVGGVWVDPHLVNESPGEKGG